MAKGGGLSREAAFRLDALIDETPLPAILNCVRLFFLILNYLNCFCATLSCRLANDVFIFFRDGVKFHNGLKLILVIFEHFGTKIVAISVTHALTVYFYFHSFASLFGKFTKSEKGWGVGQNLSNEV